MRSQWADITPWAVERAAPTPVFRQVYLQVREAILSQALSPGARLPSSRQLSLRLRVARASVVAAYEELLAEGYITGRSGSGTYVAEGLPTPAKVSRVRPHPAREANLPDHARVFEQLLPTARSTSTQPFTTGRTSVDNRTIAAWRRLSQRALRDFGAVHLGYADPRGLSALQAAVCDFLRAARAVRCEPDQIVITSGTQQGIDLAIRVLLRPGDPVWLEDPCYLLTHGALVAAGMHPVPVPVDDQGMDVAAGLQRAPRARAAYVTPSHQYPLGVTLAMPRRLALLDWAHRTGAWIIEDDYDAVFRYGGRPLASLQGLDEGQRVIYVGSLNKLLFPGLRLGYAVVPRALLPAFVNLRNLTDRHPPTFVQ
ncbi:MAG TPA: PLP-dependent aminotransferase family protein, partial [bacterium]